MTWKGVEDSPKAWTLAPTWKTLKKSLSPSFELAQLGPLHLFGGQTSGDLSLSLSLFFFLSMQLYF